MAIENELSFSDLLSIVKRRWMLMLGILILAILASIATALLMPSIYKSEGVISVEAQQIPKELVQTITAEKYNDELIDTIKQRVMSKDSLGKIIHKYNLFPSDGDPIKSVAKMTKSISVIPIIKNKSADAWSNEKVTVAFTVGFEYTDQVLTQKVANELISLFLDENAKTRTKRAAETTEFFTGELTRLKTDLEAVENKVAAYKQAHANTLPEHMEMHMTMLQGLDSDIKEVDRDYKSTQEELRYLDVELTTAMQSKDVVATTASELDKARTELERSLVLYKETHPTVRALKRKIELLEKAAQTPAPTKPIVTDAATDLAQAKIKTQIEAAKARLESLSDQKKSMLAKISQLQSQVEQTPQVERGLFTLLRDYENAKTKYDEMKSKQVNAKISENLEIENKAERFSLLVAPEFPEARFKPQRKKIVLMGVAIGMAMALALAALLEMLDKRIRNVEVLASIINMRPLAIVPYIATQAELKRNKYLTRNIILIGLISLLVLAIGAQLLLSR
jgi:polysaccharide biosynthesis transport protein